MINLILDFMKEAGEIALAYQNQITHQEKADKSLVTEADLKISKLFTEKTENLVQSRKHLIIDEENLPEIKSAFQQMDQKEYTWIIDPIDGTKAYFHGLPFWAIAVGVFKNKKPYIGAIYLPGLNELIYTDGKQTYLVKKPFTQEERKETLNGHHKAFVKNGLVMASIHNFPNDFNYEHISMMDCYGAYAMEYFTLSNRSLGTFIGKDCKLWDIAASAPIAKNLGFGIFNINTHQKLETLQDFDINENWKFKDFMLICHSENYKEIKKCLKNSPKN